MSPMEQLAKQEYERGYSDGKSDYFAAGVAEGEMRARQRMIANRVLDNQHPFAAFGKPIAEQTNTQFMEGYRIGLAEMREKCAKVCEEKRIQMNYSEAPYNQCAAAIRAEALEEAAKFAYDLRFRCCWTAEAIAAAIRGMK